MLLIVSAARAVSALNYLAAVCRFPVNCTVVGGGCSAATHLLTAASEHQLACATIHMQLDYLEKIIHCKATGEQKKQNYCAVKKLQDGWRCSLLMHQRCAPESANRRAAL